MPTLSQTLPNILSTLLCTFIYYYFHISLHIEKHQTDFVCKLQKFILSKCLRINCPLATKKQKKNEQSS